MKGARNYNRAYAIVEIHPKDDSICHVVCFSAAELEEVKRIAGIRKEWTRIVGSDILEASEYLAN